MRFMCVQRVVVDEVYVCTESCQLMRLGVYRELSVDEDYACKESC